MNIDLQKHHVAYLVPIIEARLKVVKKRVIKEFGEDWGDYDDDGLEFKVTEKSHEYERLNQTLRKINEVR